MDEPSSPVLTTRDAAILRGLIGRHGAPADGWIRDKLARARIVLPESVGGDIVTLNSRVAFAVEDAPPDMRIVIHSDAAAVRGMTLPVHSRRGLALLGARVGETVALTHDDGRCERLRVTALAYQPEAAARPRAGAVVVPFSRRAGTHASGRAARAGGLA